jgi:hypothetical protein
MRPQLAMKTKIAAMVLLTIPSTYGAVPAWDLGHFKNDTSAEVLVYLTQGRDSYYAVFGVGRGGTNIIDLRPKTTAIVTLVPRGKTGQVVLSPVGKQIARSKLFIPERARGDIGDRKLFYIIRDGKITFVASPSSNHPMQPTASPRTASLFDD